MALTSSIVIATRNRPQPLADTLRTVAAQSVSPLEVIVIDSSESSETESMVKRYAPTTPFPFRYRRASTPSAAGQRNTGIDLAIGEIIVFIDDDVDLDPMFLREILDPFETDTSCTVGGVSGLITNQCYVAPSPINAFLLGLVTGDSSGNWAGRVIGPVVNFMPADIPNTIQDVEWSSTAAVAYRRTVLQGLRFGSHFRGYSFAEDLDLSCRIARSWRLLNTTKARLYHHDLGQSTHKNWVGIGVTSVLNRHRILTEVLQRDSFSHQTRFFLFEIVYGLLAAVASSRLRPARLRQFALLFVGKAKAFWIIWTGSKERSLA